MGRARQATPEWIVCMGAQRDVLHGRVSCPTGGHVAFAVCMACRRLESCSDDRELGPCCLFDDAQAPISGSSSTERRRSSGVTTPTG
jgi:hypothetical protein